MTHITDIMRMWIDSLLGKADRNGREVSKTAVYALRTISQRRRLILQLSDYVLPNDEVRSLNAQA